jgi:hypothetical protein
MNAQQVHGLLTALREESASLAAQEDALEARVGLLERLVPLDPALPVKHAMEHAEPGAAVKVPVTKPPKRQENPYLLHSEFRQSGSPLVHVAGGGHGGLYIDPEREYKLRLMRHQHEMGKAPETHEAIMSLAGIERD